MVERYISQLTPRSRIWVRFERERKFVISFVVNFEIRYRRQWTPIVRYDTAHDDCRQWKYPHKHIFYRNGRSIILRLKTSDYNAAFTDSYSEIKKKFKSTKANFFNQ